MINIVFIIRALNYGGAERQLVNLVKAMDKEKFNPTVLSFYSGPLAQELIKGNVRTIALEKKGRWDALGFLWRLYRTIKALKPNAIHGYLAFPNVLTIMLKPFFPKTKMVFGLRASNVDYSRYDKVTQAMDSIQSYLSRFADLIIVNSKAGFKHALGKGFPEKKMMVIPNGIDTERFKPNPEAGLSVRHEWGVKDDEILIGVVGRLDRNKDHPTFLNAASLLAKQNANVRFLCLGTGPEEYRKKLLALEGSLDLSNRVIWSNTRSDMPAVFNALDISCSSSITEGFSNIIGEAMACGVPCVVTDVGDSSYIVGETGIVVPPSDPEALMAGWIECMNKDKKEKSKQARSRIQNNFSLPHLIQRTENALSFNGAPINPPTQ